ncbi:16S rRNA (guanine1207-N2)-methyltransferase [Albidovulum inexpectatum]|uniref:16S rRNA (Guanine1207-N2)-methyltransferase n=1 Tax=Albidovulum inexpectatum TaxID=196587 RepID=A0A2S5JL90_9RHOB|nr:class I SAM-dependent methyltransferase [Albidovulum inexpectatum]PPB82171.1 16S rRNA (guanine1207-N2)-methyltransferase [Albidovulum inexpectatum]
MTHPRISLALGAPGALPEQGRVLVIGARGQDDLSALPRDRSVVVQGFRPDHDALVTRGWNVVTRMDEAGENFAAALVLLPRSREQGRAWLAEAVARVRPGGPVWVDGQKTDGIETMQKELRARAKLGDVLAKAHGRILRIQADAGEGFQDWGARDLEPAPGFVTRPGVFSADRIDRGSVALAQALPETLRGVVADLGAGWGWLASRILERPDVDELHLVEADTTALDCARRNVMDDRARFHWADVATFVPERPFDVIVTNPPFHVGRDADPSLGAVFIEAAARMLTPGGRLFMVANRHLPYEPVLARLFRDVRELDGVPGFKIICAARPIVQTGRSGAAARR